MTSYENDRDADTCFSQLTLEVQTVYSWKSDIKDQATWLIRSLAGQKLLRRSEGRGTQANRLQQTLNGFTHRSIIINDEHN
jgi:hypothetical protein